MSARRREGGLRQIECTINGIGERAGNAALEEVVMAMEGTQQRRAACLGPRLTPRCSRAHPSSSAAATRFPVQFNKAIVGRNAFAHQSGIHPGRHAGRMRRPTKSSTPETVGVKEYHTGDGQALRPPCFVHKLEEMGYHLQRPTQDAFVCFKMLADRKKHIYDEDIEALVDEEIAHAQDRIKLVSLSVIAGTRGRNAPP